MASSMANSSSSSSNDNDALGLFSSALHASDPQTEATNLQKLYALFQSQPANLPILLPTLVSLVSRAKPTLKKWIADVLDLTFCRLTISSEGRASLSIHAPDAILALLTDSKLTHAKTAIQVFATIYQPVFKHCCNNLSAQRTWETIERCKERISTLFETGHMGIKVPAIKAFQKIAQTGTRASSDPRHRGSASTSDVSIANIPPSHGFLHPQALETEANNLLRQIVTLVFTSNTPDLVMACINTLTFLAKQRPTLTKIVVEALVSWTPAGLAGMPHTQVRNVEKTLRLVFWHFHRNGLAQSHGTQITQALDAQKQRMEAAARADWERRESEAKRKREEIDSEVSQTVSKRARGDAADVNIYSTQTQLGAGPGGSGSSTQQQQQQPPAPSQEELLQGARALCRAAVDESRPNPLSEFDVTSLPVGLVIDLIVANLQALTEDEMQRAISRVRSRLQHELSVASAQAAPPPPQVKNEQHVDRGDEEDGQQMDFDTPPPPEPRNPLKADIDDDEEDEEEAANQVAPGTVAAGEAEGDGNEQFDALAGLEDFQLAAPEPFSQTEAKALIKESVARMCEMGGQAAAFSAQVGDDIPAETLWAGLVTRLATRGFDGDDEEDGEGSGAGDAVVPANKLGTQADVIRQMMLDFLQADFPGRTSFATQWLSEEWFADRQRTRHAYPVWLYKIVSSVLPTLDSKDKTLFAFLSSLPTIPSSVIDLVTTLCHDESRNALGFIGLREFANSRPPIRDQVVKTLLDLARHENKVVRAPAIITVRGWIGHGGPLERRVLDSADESLMRLTVKDAESDGVAPKVNGQTMEGGESAQATPNGELSPDETLGEDTEQPAPPPPPPARDPVADFSFQLTNEDQVLQFVELPFALSIKLPDILDRVFSAYASMPENVQTALQKHIAALVRSLGPNNSKLLSLLKTFPPGSDTLALSVYNVMAEKGRTQTLISAVKTLAAERSDVDPHFLIPIMPHLTKPEILKLLPKAVAILNSKTAEDRNTLKSLFASIVTKPAQGFGSVSTNLPRVRDADNFTPVELMGLLHSHEKEIGLKTTVDAIRICFSMTDVFRSEVLAAVLNQLVEEPELPILFMRTAIMAVSTYKSLAGYVSSNLLSRLIVKKVWQNKLLWDGFVLCAEQTAPGSFAALLQLPQEQLLDVVKRKPALKEGLRAHLEKKMGNKQRLAAYLELLDGAGANDQQGTNEGRSASGTPTPVPV